MQILDKPESEMTPAEKKRLNFMRTLLIAQNGFNLLDQRADFDFTSGSRVAKVADLLFEFWDIDSLKSKIPGGEKATIPDRFALCPGMTKYESRMQDVLEKRGLMRGRENMIQRGKLALLKDLVAVTGKVEAVKDEAAESEAPEIVDGEPKGESKKKKKKNEPEADKA